jgi:prepilin-type N-terminal cleavage/methylation domain-containing protein
MPRRQGFTLVELVVAMVMALVVIGAIHRLLLDTQRLSRIQAARLDLQSNLRASALLIANELRELSGRAPAAPERIDLQSITATGLTYRAPRGIGFVCDSPGAGQFRIARSTFSGYRDPQPSRDIAYLFVEGVADPPVADSWLSLPITGVSTGSCSAGEPAIGITTGSALTGIAPGTPLRIYETMELRLYQSDGEWWLGARSVSAGEAIQPLAGPFAGSGGIRFEYLDRSGMPTSDPAAVKSIGAIMRGTTELPLPPAGERLEEQLVLQTTLRNTLR